MDLARDIPLLRDLPLETQAIVLRILLFVVVLGFVWALRRVIAAIILAPLTRIVHKSKNSVDGIILDAVRGPLNLVIIAMALAVSTSILDFGPEIKGFADLIARSMFIAAITFTAYNLVGFVALTPTIIRRATGLKIEERLLPFLSTVVKVFIVIMGTLIIIQEWGFDVTGLVASFGIVGLAFSLAAQDTAANVFGFTAIIGDNPFDVGDFIVTSEAEGIVEHVGIRSTRVRKLDQSLVTVPNNVMTSSSVTNWSRLSKRRLDFYVGLTYNTTSKQMREVIAKIKEMLLSREDVDPESVVVHFVRFGGSSLDIRIICYVFLADWNAYTAETEAINLEVMDIVESMGLGFAFPSTSVYIESVPQPKRRPASRTKRYSPATQEAAQVLLDETPRESDTPSQANESASND
ncbi:MAG: mechanosensitive ion channel family protein [Anaerolineaceae bacterium]|nr:mechanosensitive ion channel family protein [Anaerolineaceae bacterium]